MSSLSVCQESLLKKTECTSGQVPLFMESIFLYSLFCVFVLMSAVYFWEKFNGALLRTLFSHCTARRRRQTFWDFSVSVFILRS